MKHETLEEVAENESEYLADWEDKDMYKKGFQDGAKWKQERSYSEEDMREAFKSSSLTNMLNVYDSFEEFIEQFKKK